MKRTARNEIDFMTTHESFPENKGNGARARICMPSQRAVRRDAAWCSMYEFEDVICEVDHVDRIDLQAGTGFFSGREHAVQSLVWRQWWRPFARLNPGIKPVLLTRDYDIFACCCINPWELLYLNAIQGWRERCRTKICFLFEVWAGIVSRYEHLLRLLEGFDHVFIEFESSVEPVQNIIGVPCHQFSPAPDVLRFTPYPDVPTRFIDVYSIGRRMETMHRSLVKQARERNLFYIYDTIPGSCIKPRDHREHRELYANIARRSRCFVTYPAKVDTVEETCGLSEPGMRFYEGLASGAALVGQPPTCGVFKREFHWPNAVLDIGERVENLVAVMERFKREPEQYEQLSRRNATEALLGHDVSHRWAQALATAGIAPVPELEDRQRRLQELAEMAQGCVPV